MPPVSLWFLICQWDPVVAVMMILRGNVVNTILTVLIVTAWTPIQYPLNLFARCSTDSPTVFLFAAQQRAQALLLSVVCKEAHAWIARVLYRSVTFSTRQDLLRFAAAIDSRPVLAKHTRSLYIGATAHGSDLSFGTFSWEDDALAAVRCLLAHSPNIERLALVNLPPSNWHSIEERLPPHLKTLALGPSYGLLGLNVAHTGLERFYYADTLLQSAELARIARLPSLTDFRWRSPLRFDDVVYTQLKTLLASRSLRNLHVTLFGTEEDLLKLYRDEYEELVGDGRLTIVCDPLYEGSREWIEHFHKEWREVEV
ncbi:hypothetical protein K439DRAFT_1558109 [Ramaria rubella]|nr:hypothetical protein K439DRAFT_1558109 [Ramaria rubella]